MIVVDSSVIIACLFEEKGYERYVLALQEAEDVLFSSVNYVESSMVHYSRRKSFSLLDELIQSSGIEIVAADERVAELARRAFVVYGRGNHTAKLNICDCFAYALAKDYDAPLLYKGDDFSKTDIVSVFS